MALLTQRFENALVYAARLHQDQYRKSGKTPYIAHLLAVTALVLENGGDEDQAIAALLHDSVEDQGGKRTLEEISARFGKRVANIVEACSDTLENPKPPWRLRKEAYLNHLPSSPPEALLVSLADKVHNARAILSDYPAIGEEFWEQFRGKKPGTLWYYRELAKIFKKIYSGPLSEELVRIVTEIEALV